MRLNDIPEIYYITHIDNLGSIFKLGILCRTKIPKTGVPFRDCSNKEVQERRNNKYIDAKSLHEYVCLFFATRAPFLYDLQFTQSIPCEEICYLCVDRNLLNERGVWYTDGNAASYNTRFYYDLKYLDKLDWEILLDPDFQGQNPNGEYIYPLERDPVNRKAAEVLVPLKVPIGRIQRIVVYDSDAAKKVKEIVGESIKIDVDKSFFY